jgi:plastocyanin
MKGTYWLASGLLSLALVPAGCENMESSPTSPDPIAPGTSAATIMITSSGLEPRTVAIQSGQAVTFINNDSVAHNMASDPHPIHNECPAINQVGNLGPGQQMQSAALTATRSCGFHDLLRDGDPRWQGTIVVQ